MLLWRLHPRTTHKYADTRTQVGQDSAIARLSSQDLDVGSKNAGCGSSVGGCHYLFLEQNV